MSACSFPDGHSVQLTDAQQQQQTFGAVVWELPICQRDAATSRFVSSLYLPGPIYGNHTITWCRSWEMFDRFPSGTSRREVVFSRS